MKARDFVLGWLKRSLRKTNVLTGIVLAFIVASAGLYAADIVSSLITFNAGDPASASQVNYNFQTLGSAIEKNREGFICELTTAITLEGAGTPNAFTCGTYPGYYPSQPTGAAFFQPSESGVYQFHRKILINMSSAATSSHSIDSSFEFHQVYINTTLQDQYKEFFNLQSGDTVEISVEDTSGAGGSWVMPGSVIYVKRLF